MDIKIPDNVKEVIGKRGIKEADIEAVVKEAESSNKKLVKNGRNLAKKKIGDVLVYVDYDIDKGVLSKHAKVNSAYTHRIALQHIVNADGPSGWTCAHCNEAAAFGHVQMEYMTVKRNGPAVVCAKCGDSWAEEYLATKTLAAVEGLFEKKRA